MPDVVNPTQKAHYLSDLEKLKERVLPEWARALRTNALSHFHEMEFPHRRMEAWRYTNVSPIVNTPFRSLLEPAPYASRASLDGIGFDEHGWTELVFIDGFYAPNLSRHGDLPEGVRVGSLADAVQRGDALVQQHLGRYAGVNGNIFNALNAAFLMDGAFVHVPAQYVVPNPIHFVFLSTAPQENTATHPRNLVIVDRQAELTLIETYAGIAGDACYLSNAVTEISLGDGARLRRYSVLDEGANGYHMSTVRARQDRSSSFTSFVLTKRARIGRNELTVALDGEGAECSLNGLYMADGDQLIDNATGIEHLKPHCASWIGYKGILDDQASAVFSGRIFVERGAQKTDSKQLNNNMLLSDTATVDTKPLLEIFADDVKCTHGATVGLPPKELIFYFQTRGMSEAMARGMLTYGFAGAVVNAIEVEALRKRMDRYVFERYSP